MNVIERIRYALLSKGGRHVYNLLNDETANWVMNEWELWVEPRDPERIWAHADKSNSPCILWVCSGVFFLNDNRLKSLFKFRDKFLLIGLVLDKMAELYFAIPIDCTYKKIKGMTINPPPKNP